MLLGGGGEAVVFRIDSVTAVKRFRNASLNLSPAAHAEFTFDIKWLIHQHILSIVSVLELDIAADIAAGCLSMEFVDSGSWHLQTYSCAKELCQRSV
jgi:hypothetical protein